jgi:hypothetical protein
MATTTATDGKPGDPNGAAPLRRAGKHTGAAVAAVKANADRRAINMAGIVAAIRANGATSLKEVADELNRKCITTARGRRWYPSTVRDLEARVQRQTRGSHPDF